MRKNIYIRLLSSCKNLSSLLKVHARMIIAGLGQDASTTTHLINSYSSLQRCDLARSVLDSALTPTVVSWNSMIRAYSRSNRHQEALKMYRSMVSVGLEPDRYTFTFVLKACAGALDMQEGASIHREVCRRGLDRDVFICTGLIDMYCKTGYLESAREIFDHLHVRDVVTWNSMIAGLSHSLDPIEALSLFKRMQLTRVVPQSVSLLNLFPAISRLADVDSCRCMHAYGIRMDFGLEFSNALIDTYAKCGDVESARLVFDLIFTQDDVSWSTMMAGYAHNGCFSEVLGLYDKMKERDLQMNKVSVISALLAAGDIKDLEKGKEIHNFAKKKAIDMDVVVATPTITMYAKCGELEKAEKLLKGLPGRDLVAWSALIAVLVQSGYPEKALSLLQDMENENIKPNKVTLMSILPACAELSSLRLGKSIHCCAIKADVDSDIPMGTALMSMYAKCGHFRYAHILFDTMQSKDVVTWNALINGYSQNGEADRAIEMYQKLQCSGLHPDAGTMVGLIPACALYNDLKQGTSVHALSIKSGFDSDCHVNSALIDMYSKCGNLPSALYLFNRLDFIRDEVSWNIMIAAFTQNGEAKKALSAFHQMRLENHQPNLVTYVSILPAAAYLAALREGMSYHSCIIKMGFLSHVMVGNSLIDMYAKCGKIDLSKRCFDEIQNKDIASWNSMLAGYAVHGEGDHAIALFLLMQKNHIEVDSVSYVNVLSACRHAGLIEEGKKIFHTMQEESRIQPDAKHYACMVDLLGRAGLFDETLSLIEKMPMEPDAGVWGALLGASMMHSNVKLGEVALKRLAEIEPGNPTHFVVLSNMYAQSGRWADAGKRRLNLKDTGMKKTPGCSWFELKNRIHTSLVGDSNHP
ncbi:pentatricopeptide repeat-containing protein At2g39620 isoform X1 [Eucalyptus grandis]|uniref:pentatricopeptide repeat-containing protein At2g39620 isoform X1 n=2 Tax=Eucalyptus grandis TaxID=71139 RepID=UPI00192E9B93|nr:pentatricopeptide repeat-containing protein At2g39620 isoform X1 [Eucalyptus grandis]XP_039159148.1 pentatricopeptide repeat-containing protein At2g39620 isoform X1 [Eucalyptus grandis]XP_039159149.1 pentatricopeptide repeat-containing protein At2g39620 isoform X1 [Eucalyptus grandis]